MCVTLFQISPSKKKRFSLKNSLGGCATKKRLRSQKSAKNLGGEGRFQTIVCVRAHIRKKPFFPSKIKVIKEKQENNSTKILDKIGTYLRLNLCLCQPKL